MNKPTVLVIEDEKDVIELVRCNLEKEGFDVIGVNDGQAGFETARDHLPDVILLDLMLPGLSGLEVCRLLRAHDRTARLPLIMVTAKGEETDRVVGLEMGADDYITKPFSPRELVARVRAVLRRATEPEDKTEVLRAGDLVVDGARYTVTCAGTAVALTTAEFRILQFLAGHPERVYTRNELIDAALGRDTAILDRTIDVHLTSIRKKLGPCSGYLKTVRGVGYKFEADEARPAKRKP